MSTKVNYKGSQIATVGPTQTKTLLTAGQYCEDNITLVNDDIFETILHSSYVGEIDIVSTMYGWAPHLRDFLYSCVPSNGFFFFVYKGSWVGSTPDGNARLFIGAVNNRSVVKNNVRGTGVSGNTTNFSHTGNWLDANSNNHMYAGDKYYIYQYNSEG